nr:hypothetical protein [Tanacetum cinerariifolium]
MTDYSSWEVILNEDSPVPTRIVEGVIQPIAPTTAEQKLARKNELKARGTLLMAFPDKHQLKFNSHKDAKILMEAIEKRFGGNTKTKKVQKTLLKQQYENFTGSSSESLDQIHDRLQKLVSQVKIHEVSLSHKDVNLKFLRSLPSEWKSHTLIWRNKADLEEQSLDDLFNISVAASVFVVCAKMSVSSLPNVDFLSNAVIYSFFASQSTSPQLDNKDLKQIDTSRNLGANGPTYMGFDMSKVECYNYYRKGHFARECRSPKDSRRNGAAEPHKRTVSEEPANFALMAFSALSSSSDTEVFTRAMFDCDDYLSSEGDCESWPPSSLYDRFQPCCGYHAVPPPYTGTFMPPKPDLVFNTTPTTVETDHPAFTVQLSPTKPAQDLSHINRPTTPIIKDWVSDSEDESETKAPQIVPSFVQSSEQVKTPRHSVQPVKTSISAATPKPASLKSNSSGTRRNKKACFVCKSVDDLIKDCDYHAKKMAQPTPRNYVHMGNHKQYASLTLTNPHKHMVPAAVLTQSKPVSFTAVGPVVPKIKVTRPRLAHPIVTKSKSPIGRHITRSQSPKTSNSPPRVTVVQAPVVSDASSMQGKWGNPQYALKDKRANDSGCSWNMTGNMSFLSDFHELNGGYVSFGGNPNGGKISDKGKIKTGKLDFEDVYFVKELQFNLFSVLQMCDKKYNVLFTDTECLVFSLDFKLPDESQVLLRVPRENNMYNVNLKNIVPSGDLTCLFAKATIDESNLCHRRLARVNFKTINKLVKCNLVRGLPIKVFKNDHTCVACMKGKKHKASCKTKPVNYVDQPLYRLHMDLFGPTFVKSLNKKSYCLVVTDDYSRFTWLCGMKGIKKEFSIPRTPQQNGIAERKNMTFIEAAKTMLVDLLLPIPFWVEAVNTACYVQNRVLVTKHHNKTPYELLHGRTPSIGFMRPFGCHVTILNTLDSLGKFKGKVDEGFLVGYSVNSKAFRVFNSRTRIVQETLHVNFLENKPNVTGSGPTWLFDIDSLTRTMNYQPVTAGNQTNPSEGFQDKFDAEKAGEEINQQYVLFLVWSFGSTNPQNYDGDAAFDGKEHDSDAKKPEYEVILSPSSSAQSRKQDDKTKKEAKRKSHVESFTRYRDLSVEFKDCSDNSSIEVNVAELKDIIYSDDDNDVGAEADFNNLETSITEEPKRVHQALKDSNWIETMREELLQFKMQKVWVLVDLPHGKRAIGFEDPNHPDKVYKVVKALYGLHQAPRAWYETLANYLLENSFQRGKIDQTLFIKRQKGDILLVQIYVDDIIFGATNKNLCKSFEKLMEYKFQMSSIGELTFFLGLHVKQKKDGIFNSQDKYVAEILRKFGLTEGKSDSTPIDTEKPLLKDPDGEDVDVHTYRSMIDSLMYLTSSRPYIMFVVCACARFQVTPKASYLHAVKRIFRYLKGVNTPRSDEDRLELMELTVFSLSKVKKVRIGVNDVDLQVSAVRHILLLLVQKFLLFKESKDEAQMDGQDQKRAEFSRI